MIVRNIDFPDEIVKGFIGEQAMIIDNLAFIVRQKDEKIKALEAELEQIKKRKKKLP